MAIDLKVISESSGKSSTTTVSDINPAATNAQLRQLGTKLVTFSTNAYTRSEKVETTNVDTTPGGGVKPEPTLTLSSTTCAVSEIPSVGNNYKIITYTTNSDGNVYFRPATFLSSGANSLMVATRTTDSTNQFLFNQFEGNLVPQTVYIGVTETDNYAGKEAAFTITAE